jgi:hypothetical protein
LSCSSQQHFGKSTNYESLHHNFHQPPVSSSLLGRNILISTLFSNTLKPCTMFFS